MPQNKRLLALAAAAVAASLLTVPPARAAKTLTVVAGLAKTHDQVVSFFQDFFNPLNAANGPIHLRFIGGPEVTPAKEQGAALKRGLVDILFGPSSYYAGLVPEARLTAPTNRSSAEIRAIGGMKKLQAAWKKGINARILAWPFSGGSKFNIYTTFKPTLSKKTGIDLAGHKMRTTALYNPFIKAMHGTPIVISAGEVYTALQRGLVTGLAWPEGAIAKYGWQKFIKYRIDPGFWRSSSMLVINLDKWNALSADEKAFLNTWALKFEKDGGKTLRKFADIDNAKIFKAGVKKVELKGEYEKAYLRTVNGSTWADAKARKLTVPYKTIRAVMLKE